MLLKELFQADKKQPDPDINWIEDLKVFLDNDDEMLSKYFFPAVDQHKQDPDNDEAYKFYIKPLSLCAEKYCSTYDIPDKNNFFPAEKIADLAKMIAAEQKSYIKRGDYK